MSIALTITDAAAEDIEEARLWYETKQTGLGAEFLTLLSDSLEIIEKHPKQFAIRFDSVRAAPMRKFPYLIFYRIQEDVAEVIAVGHTSRNPNRWRRR